MGKKKQPKKSSSGNGANLGFEAKLWLAADKMQRLTNELNEQFAQSADLETRIRDNLASLGYDLGLGHPDDVSK